MRIRTQVAGVRLGTDINQVQVPDRLRLRQDLGLPWLNEALGGLGMTPSTVAMITGFPGCGKSTLLRQLADSITAMGHRALYNVGEESVYQVKMRCEEMGLRSGFAVGQETSPRTLLDHMRSVQASDPLRQAFLLQDSLQTLDDGHYANGTTGMTPVRCCEQLCDWAKETFGIAVFVGQVTKAGLFAGKNTIRHAVDVHLELLPDTDPRSPTYKRTLLTVTKNRFGCSGRSYLVSMGVEGLRAQAVEAAEELAEREHAEPGRPSRTQSGFQRRPAAGR